MEILAAVLGFLGGVLAGLFGVGGVDWRAALLLGLGSIAGVAGGVELAKALPEDVLRRLFAVFMLAVAASVAWRAVRMKPAYPRADDSA